MVLTLLTAVIVVDQAAKWWAWRHVSGASINPGGDFLTGPTIGRWYANPVTGALLDLVDFGLVSTAVAILVRRRRLAVTVCGSLMVGGWASNLFDRLGMHYWTAPGSIRGAVDFIGVGGRSWNLADFFIIGATPVFLLVTTQLAKRTANRPPPARHFHAIRNSLRTRVPAVAAAGAAMIMTVALGATHHGSLTKPPHTAKDQPACASNSPVGTAVGHLDQACTTGTVKTAVRRWGSAQLRKAADAAGVPRCRGGAGSVLNSGSCPAVEVGGWAARAAPGVRDAGRARRERRGWKRNRRTGQTPA